MEIISQGGHINIRKARLRTTPQVMFGLSLTSDYVSFSLSVCLEEIDTHLEMACAPLTLKEILNGVEISPAEREASHLKAVKCCM